MVHKKEERTYHRIEKLTKEMPGFLSPGRGLPLLLIPEYSEINKEQRIPDRSKTAHRKPPVKCFLTFISPCYSLKLFIQLGISFPFSFAFHVNGYLLLFLSFQCVLLKCTTNKGQKPLWEVPTGSQNMEQDNEKHDNVLKW